MSGESLIKSRFLVQVSHFEFAGLKCRLLLDFDSPGGMGLKEYI